MSAAYYDQDGITIYHGDWRDVVPYLSGVDGIVSDPPYGMDWNVDSARFSGGHWPKGSRPNRHSPVAGDTVAFDPTPWLAYPRVILWGCNHFAQQLPAGTTLVWIKRLERAFGSFLSDAELAWQKGGHGVYCHRDTTMCGGAPDRRAHPTEKPLGLMRWCLERLGPTEVVLDPFMGSGTTLRAAKDLGRQAVGI